MFLSLTMKTVGGSADIRIDSEQEINAGLRVLRESGKLPDGSMPDFFRSQMNQTSVSAWRTFEEEQVFEGDMLIAIEQETGENAERSGH